MTFAKQHILLFVLAGILLFSAALLMPGSSARAQCGSQASSCKSCHEVQAKDPVNADGTGWHESHAFGDFCYICHAGNSQSMDEATAHAGMVAPLSDIQAACQTCHPNDAQELAQVYAAQLGVTVGEGSPPSPPPMSGSSDDGNVGGEAAPQPASQPESSSSLVLGDPAIVDYQQRYEEVVTGVRPINVGNVIAGTLVFSFLLGGGAFVVYNERKRADLPFFRQRSELTATRVKELEQIEGLPAEVVALLPQIAKLNPLGLHALQRLLENPDAASALFHSLSRLDPELVNRVRGLDRSSRELLLALAGN